MASTSNSTTYSAAERALIDVHKDEYMKLSTPALRTAFLTTKVYESVAGYWDKHGIKYDPSVQKAKLCKWARNSWRQRKVDGVVKPQSGLINVKKSDIISRTRKDEVEQEIDRILGPTDAIDHSKRFGVRATAIGNILARMQPAEIAKLEEEVEKVSQEGYSEAIRRQLAGKYFEKRLNDSATANWLELGMLSITFTTYEDTSGRLHVEVHDQISELLNLNDVPDVKGFEEVHSANVCGMQRLVLEYVRNMLNLYRGTTQHSGVKENVVGRSEDGFPIILPTYNKETLTRDGAEALCREYFSKHYELATNYRTTQVPWGDLKGRVSTFIREEYLPSGFDLKDPHNNTVNQNISFLDHIAEREKVLPPAQVFRFHSVTSRRRQGMTIPSIYPDEYSDQNPPQVPNSRKRKRSKGQTGLGQNSNVDDECSVVDTSTFSEHNDGDVNMFSEHDDISATEHSKASTSDKQASNHNSIEKATNEEPTTLADNNNANVVREPTLPGVIPGPLFSEREMQILQPLANFNDFDLPLSDLERAYMDNNHGKGMANYIGEGGSLGERHYTLPQGSNTLQTKALTFTEQLYDVDNTYNTNNTYSTLAFATTEGTATTVSPGEPAAERWNFGNMNGNSETSRKGTNTLLPTQAIPNLTTRINISNQPTAHSNSSQELPKTATPPRIPTAGSEQREQINTHSMTGEASLVWRHFEPESTKLGLTPKRRSYTDIKQATPSKIMKGILSDMPLLPPIPPQNPVSTASGIVNPGAPSTSTDMGLPENPTAQNVSTRKGAKPPKRPKSVSKSSSSMGTPKNGEKATGEKEKAVKSTKKNLTADDLAAQEARSMNVEGKRVRKKKNLE